MSSASPAPTDKPKAKPKGRNLPKKFGLKISSGEEETEAPATTGGDYLDLDADPSRTNVSGVSSGDASEASAAAASSPMPAEASKPAAVVTPTTPSNTSAAPIAESTTKTVARKAPKKYRKRTLNLVAKVEGMWDEVLVLYESKIADRIKIKQSDVFEANVRILHDARANVNLSRVRHRGPWGSAQVDAFRTQLKDAIEEGIVRTYLKRRGIDFDELPFDESSPN